MAALCTGNYGLSQNCTDDSKEYFFVKLTDSAYRAVEEYQKNQNKYNTHATIQIIGNGGVLSFPTVGGNVGQQFSFSIDEIEGSFECIRQTQNQLDVLGALPYKMRIHANDDVYETTRYRMAVAEETQKNKCTREIKPNQTDIGRKVKLKNSLNRLTNIPPKRDQVLNNLVNSSSSVSSSSSSSLLNNLSSSSNSNIINNSPSTSSYLMGSNHNLPTSLSPILSLNGNSNHSNSNSIITTTTTTSIGNHHSSSNSSLSSTSSSSLTTQTTTTTNHHSNGPLKNSSSSILSSNSLNNLSHHSSSSKLLSGFTSASGLTPGISSASSLSSALSSAAGSGTSGINNGYFNSSNSSNRNTIINCSSGSRRGLSNLTGNSNRSQKNGSRHIPDITKRKIRERLIHLLALKPFKKPELYARLQNEGIRDKEKNLISGILKEISTMRDNTYNLKRQIWNDVNEDWPFYSEQELQMLKRRKPQNLTPPLSSDGGSSTSGQSPTSTHNGSPPPAVKRPSIDRDRFYEEPTAKKQRISHFRKETNEISSRRTGGIPNSRDSHSMNTSRSRENHDIRTSSSSTSSNYFGSNKHHHEPEDNGMGLSYSVLGNEAARRISPRDELAAMMMNGHSNNNNNNNSNSNNSSNGGHYHHPNSNHHHHNHHHHNPYHHSNNHHTSSNNNGSSNNNNIGNHSNSSSNSLKENSNSNSNSLGGNGVNIRQQPNSPSLYNNTNSSSSSSRSSSSNNNNSNNNNGNHHNNNNSNSSNIMNGDSHSVNARKRDSPSPITLGVASSNGGISSSSSSTTSPNRANVGSGSGGGGGSSSSSINNSSNSSGMMRTSSPMSGLIERGSAINNNSNNMMNQNNGNSSSSNINSNSTNNGTIGGPLTNNTYDFSRFTKITSIEQRRLYKTEFENDYDEYRQLLHKIESVGERFKILAQRLNNARNNDANYKLIKRQILSEYEKINREQEHQRARARFDYLHAKLAHIKSLVNDFDEQIKSSISSSSTSSSSLQQQQQSIGGQTNESTMNSRISSLSPSNSNNCGGLLANMNVNTQNLSNSNSNCINSSSNHNNNNNNSNNHLTTNSSSSSLNSNNLRTSSSPPLSHNLSSSTSSSSGGPSSGLIHIKQENY